MEVKVVEIIDINKVVVDFKGNTFAAKWLGQKPKLGDTFQVEIEINEKFILNTNMYFHREEIPSAALETYTTILPVKVLQKFDDKVIAVNFEYTEESFLIEVENLANLDVGVSFFIITDLIELWSI